MRNILLSSVMFLIALGAFAPNLWAQGGSRPRPQTWVDCQLFDGVVTPATFKPESDPFDELYTGGDGFQDGVPLISESKPGDQDFNGGRWHVNMLREGVAADKYANSCTVEDLDLDDFESTDAYFECPLLPSTRAGGPGGERIVAAIVSASEGPDFMRGDSNADGTVDLTDGVSVLAWLFLGETGPGCLDAVDTDDSGYVDVSDALATLGFIILGEAPPAAPGPDACGSDLTIDELDCAEFDYCS